MAKQMKYTTLLNRIKKGMRGAVFGWDNVDLLRANLTLMLSGREPINPTQVKNASGEELLARCTDVVLHWDIRQVHELAEIFPTIVPQWVKNCDIEYRDTPKGSEWYLVSNVIKTII